MTQQRDLACPESVAIGLCAHALAIVRDLARGGVSVLALESNSSLPGYRTRLADVNKAEDINTPHLVADLVRLARDFREGSKPVLFPSNDNTVRVLATHWDELAPSYRLSWEVKRDVVLSLLDKDRIEARCSATNLDYPVCRVLQCAGEVEGLEQAPSPFPAIVKPVRPLSGFKAMKVDSFDELRALTRQYPSDFPMLLQQWVEGDDSSLYFCALYLHEGEVVETFTGRKLASLPRAMGQTTVAENTVCPAIEKLTARFFEGLGLSGPVSLEFKRDAGRDDSG